MNAFFEEWAVSNIPVGKEKAITRDSLCNKVGLSDRNVRKFIEEARNAGVLIVNCGDGNGYYITDDLDEIERQYHKDRSRALNILKRLKSMRKILKENGRNV